MTRTLTTALTVPFYVAEALLAVGLAVLLGPVVLPVALITSSRMARKAVLVMGLVITVAVTVIGITFTPAEFQAFRGAF